MRILSLRRAGTSPVVCLGLLAAAVGLLSGTAAAQPCEAGWLAGDTRDVVSREGFTKALSFAPHPSGDIIIAGEFRPSGNWPHQGIVRYNLATNSFVQMGEGIAAGAMNIATLPDGDAIALSNWAGGTSVPGIARYDFETATWSSIGSTRPTSIATMVVAPDGGVIVGGDFTSIGQLPVNRIARLDSNTGVWTPLGDGFAHSVGSVVVLPDGVIVASLSLTASGIQPPPGLAMFDPAVGTWTPLPGTTQPLSGLVVGANGVLFALGEVTIGNITNTTVFRYDRIAQQWTALGLATVGNSWPSKIAVRPDGTVVGMTSRGASLLDVEADAWVELGSWGIEGGFAIGVAPNNDVFVGGHLRLASPNALYGSPNGIARYQERFRDWTHIGRGLDDRVTEFALADDGTVWIGGRFRTADGQPAGRIARFDPAQRECLPIYSTSFVTVDAIHTNPQYGLVVGSMVLAPSEVNVNRKVWSFDIARSSWVRVGTFEPPSQQPWLGVRDLRTLDGGDLLALGPELSRLNPTSGVWSRLASGNFTTSLRLPTGEIVIAGGRAKLFDPETNQLTNLGEGPVPNLSINALALLPDGDLLVGGSSSGSGGLVVRGLARYDFQTATWSEFAGGVTGSPSVVHALHVTPDGRVIVGGRFSNAGSVPANNIAQFNLAGNAWQALGSGLEGGTLLDPSVFAIQPMPDGGFLVGGAFTRAGGVISRHLARYATTNPPAILQQPRPALLCSGGEITMSFGIGSTREAAFRWQWQPPASSQWLDLVEGDNLVGDVPVLTTSGVNRRTISASALEGLPTESPIQLRCIATTPCGEVTSTAASLTLRAPCACYDFNRDLEVDLADAHDMAAVFTGLRLSETNWLDGDLNGDENADLTDAQLLAAYVVRGNCGV